MIANPTALSGSCPEFLPITTHVPSASSSFETLHLEGQAVKESEVTLLVSERCTICQTKDMRTPAKVTNCGHIFHRRCIEQARQNGQNFSNCPNCRTSITSLEPVFTFNKKVVKCKKCRIALCNENEYIALEHSGEDKPSQNSGVLATLLSLCLFRPRDCHKIICERNICTLQQFLEITPTELREVFGMTLEGSIQRNRLQKLHLLTEAKPIPQIPFSALTQAARTVGSATHHTATIAVLQTHNAILRSIMISSFGGSLSWVGGAAGLAVQIGLLYRDYQMKEITWKQFRTYAGVVTISSAFGVAAGVGGTVGGAMLGTMVFPGIGTIIGGILGGFLAGLAVSMGLQFVAEKALEKWCLLSDEEEEREKLESERTYKNACTVLGINDNTPTRDVIRKRNLLALKYHPDKLSLEETSCLEDAQQTFVKVMAAFEIVKNKRTIENNWNE